MEEQKLFVQYKMDKDAKAFEGKLSDVNVTALLISLLLLSFSDCGLLDHVINRSAALILISPNQTLTLYYPHTLPLSNRTHNHY